MKYYKITNEFMVYNYSIKDWVYEGRDDGSNTSFYDKEEALDVFEEVKQDCIANEYFRYPHIPKLEEVTVDED